jgi:glycosyltransferase involved in cell wall biosynthesis
MKNNKPIVFLYSELAEYILACIAVLAAKHPNIHVVKWPTNSEAPFQFRKLEGVSTYKREDYTPSQLLELLEEIKPALIISSGWMDKGYVNCCKHYFGRCNTVLTLDNHWQGDLKQIIKTKIAKYYFKKIFSAAWIPGEPQIEFIQKLGFKNYKTGLYCADFNLFKPNPTKKVNRKLLFVGRYLEFKGIFELWDAFVKLKSNQHSKWELHCAGNGDLWENRTLHESIVHHGFLQPAELAKVVHECDAFVLPSHKEPWGVVVHEMAASGLALLCSDKIGAAAAFLKEGKNGFTFEHKNSESLYKAITKFTELEDSEILKMGNHSLKMAQKITPEKWAQTALELID